MPELAVAASRASVRDALHRAAEVLSRAGCDTSRLDAEVLLAFALDCDRAALVLRSGEALSRPVAARFEQLVARREAREPVAYITGRREFRRLSLAVDRRVLIPRPETELLVEAGLTLAPGARVADVGTGSGAVALALKDERPDLHITGLDISASALTVARANASRLGLEVAFRRADLLDDGDYDAVVANLPYVRVSAPLPPEVSRYEPEGALYAGPDGLALVRRLVDRLATVQTVALEVGCDQAAAVAGALAAAGFGHRQRLRDLAGHERVVLGRR